MNEQPTWRLTDEEITRTVMLALAEAARRADLANADEHRAVADAQARKLVEEIARHVVDRGYRIGWDNTVSLDGAFWQQLKKED